MVAAVPSQPKCEHPSQIQFETCSQCGSFVFPSKALNYFELFQLPVDFDLPLSKLTAEFYSLSRKIHPDKFYASPQEMEKATEWFAQVTKGFEILKNSEKRASYMMDLLGGATTSSSSKPPPELALKYFDLQESLEESDDEKVKKQLVQSFLTELNEEKNLVAKKIANLFSQWKGQNYSKESLPKDLRKALDTQNYLKSVTADVENKWAH